MRSIRIFLELPTDINILMKTFHSFKKDMSLPILTEGNIDATDLYKRDNLNTVIKRSLSGELIYSPKNKPSFNLQTVNDSSEWIQALKQFDGVDKGSSESQELQQAFKNTYGKGFSLGNVDKIQNGLSTRTGKDPSGEDWESLIAVGCKVYNKLPIDGPEWDRAQKYWQDFEKPSLKLGQEFSQKLGVGDLKQLGASTLPITPEWSKWGASNRTPKTDLIDGGKKISLKKSGGSQLMSAGKYESIATVNAAMATYSLSSHGKFQITKLVNLLEEKMVTLPQKDTIRSIDALAKKGTLSDKEMKMVKELDVARIGQDEINAEMKKVFDNEVFKSHFCFEAATGQTKFGKNSEGASNVVVTFKDSGTISDILQLDSPEGAGKTLARGNKFYVSFKTGSGSAPYLSLRSGKLNKKVLTDSTFSDIVKNTLSESSLLMEEVSQLDEFAALRKLYSLSKTSSGKLLSKVKQALETVIAKVKNAFKYILTLGKNIMSALLRFFGIRINNVTVKGGGKYPLL